MNYERIQQNIERQREINKEIEVLSRQLDIGYDTKEKFKIIDQMMELSKECGELDTEHKNLLLEQCKRECLE